MVRIRLHVIRKKRAHATELLLSALLLAFGVGLFLELTWPALAEARTGGPRPMSMNMQEPLDQNAGPESSGPIAIGSDARSAPSDTSSQFAADRAARAGSPDSLNEAATDPEVKPGPPDSLVALYFHRTLRCEDCLLMEIYIRDVLESDYLDPLLEGTLRWRSLDYEQPEHAGSAEKYQFGGPALVLSHWSGGREALWARMDEIWQWVDYPDAVADMLRAQLRECLAGTCRHDEFHMPDAGDARAPGDTTRGSQERTGTDNDQR